MDVYERISQLAKELEMRKEAAAPLSSAPLPSAPKPPSRALWKDFAAGVDPTGATTSLYGMKDVDQAAPERSKRLATGVAGGLVGGAVGIPAAISGVVGGVQGMATGGLRGAGRGFVKGLHAPFTGLAKAVKGSRALARVEQGARLLPKEEAALRQIAANAPGLNLLEKVVPQKRQMLAGALDKFLRTDERAALGLLRRGAARKGKEMLQKETASGAATLGLSGALGAGSAGFQYRKGQQTGELMTPEQRAKL